MSSGDFVVVKREYVVGGESADSLDSRYFGAIPARWIEGRAHRVF
ncbi:MAG: S26 family signal peptidase [Gammaproteobacteria bacterium]|nr:S26 family signal peptidase [Gammaproteobacteria bacterium]